MLQKPGDKQMLNPFPLQLQERRLPFGRKPRHAPHHAGLPECQGKPRARSEPFEKCRKFGSLKRHVAAATLSACLASSGVLLSTGERAHAMTVKDVQLALMRHCSGLPADFADGIAGKMTREAVTRFQSRYFLEADGVVGPGTIAALDGPVSGNCTDIPNVSDEGSEGLIGRPGIVAVDAVERRRQLEGAGALDRMCEATDLPASVVVLHDIKAPDDYGLDDRYLVIDKALRLLGAGCLKGNSEACLSIQAAAREWATGSGLSHPKGREEDSARFWNDTLTIHMRLLVPLISALGIAEQHSPLPAEDRKIVDPWLKKIFDAFEHGERNDRRYNMPKEDLVVYKSGHNHAAFSSISAMSYGAWTNDPAYFRIGLDQWRLTLGSMRPDGSLPVETRRGSRALFYSGRTLTVLAQLAERAAVQGIDLYDFAPLPGKSYHKAVEYFLDAMEDPELILQYAWVNKAPGPNKDYTKQDMARGGNRHNIFAWIAPYMSRFPEHPNVRRLEARRALDHSEPRNELTPALDDAVRHNGYSVNWVGVDARCAYANPELD